MKTSYNGAVIDRCPLSLAFLLTEVSVKRVLFVLQSQARLGQLRVEANHIKSSLEEKIVVHKAAVKRAKTIERHMQVSSAVT